MKYEELLIGMKKQKEMQIPVFQEQIKALQNDESIHLSNDILPQVCKSLNELLEDICNAYTIELTFSPSKGFSVKSIQLEEYETVSVSNMLIYDMLGINSRFLLKDFLKAGLDFPTAWSKVYHAHKESVDRTIREFRKMYPNNKLFDIRAEL